MLVGMARTQGMEGQVRAGRKEGLLSAGDMTYAILQIYGNDIPTHGLPQSLQASRSKNAVCKSLAQCSFNPPHDQLSVIFCKYLGFEASFEVSTFSHSPCGVFLKIPAI
jgi:hypothetical protein